MLDNSLSLMLLLNWWVATGTLIFEIAVVGKLFSLIMLHLDSPNFIKIIFETKQKIFQKFGLDVLSENFLLIFVFILSSLASVLTLIYSEIFLQVPCALCWFERIFMYGIVIISGVSLFARNNLEQRGIMRYLLVFSFFGAVIALYHHVLQMTASLGSHLPCPTSGGDCAKRIIFEYDHITFPWMAFVMFTFFIVIILLQRKLQKI